MQTVIMTITYKSIVFTVKVRLDFPGGPAVKTPRFYCRWHGFDPWLGN